MADLDARAVIADGELFIRNGTSVDGISPAGLAALSDFTTVYVALTGAQNVAGVKTFTDSPIVPTPTTDFQAATKKYVDDNIGGGGGDILSTDTTVAPGGDYWDWVDNDDTMAADSDTVLPTQGNVVAYVASQAISANLASTDTDVIDIYTSGGVTYLDVSGISAGTYPVSDADFSVADDGDPSKILEFNLASVTTATTRTLTVPDLSGTVVLTTGAQSVSAKTFSTCFLSETRSVTGAETSPLLSIAVVDVDMASGIVAPYMDCAASHTYQQAGTATGANRFAYSRMTIKNNAASAVGPGGTRTFEDVNTLTADTQTGLNAGAYVAYRASTIYGTTGGGTWTAGTYQAYVNAVTVGASTTLSTVNSFASSLGAVAGTITTLNHIKINTPTITGTVTTQYGIDIAALASAGTNIGIRNLSTSRLAGAVTFGADAAATWLMHLQGGNAATNALGFDTSTTSPTVGGSSTQMALSMYSGSGGTNKYILFTYNDGGTTRYKYMLLNGTGTTWTHSTTLPT